MINELNGRGWLQWRAWWIDACAADLSINHFGANGIVGGELPIACGIALSLKMDQSKSIVFCFFGDGASNQRLFWKVLILLHF